MVSLPESSAPCQGGEAVTGLKPKRTQRKGKSGQGKNSASNTAGPPVSDEFDGFCDPSEQATGSTGCFPVISTLQEFLQDSKTFRVPNQHSILQWNFEQSFGGLASSKFRATVAFLLEGVPHHVAGDWHNSKSGAKRDAAERALRLFVTQWGSQLLPEEQASQADLPPGSRNLLQNLRSNDQVHHADVDTLMNFCAHFPPCQQSLPQVSVVWEGDDCKGFAQISLFGVPHTFAGVPCRDDDEACIDVARRCLWYLQCPRFVDKFELDYESLLAGSGSISSPPSDWTAH